VRCGVVLLVLLLIKQFFLDTSLVKTGQMEPALLNGDQVLMWRLGGAAPLRIVMHPRRNRCIVYRDPFDENKRRCLRIAALAGDSVSIRNGSFVNHTAPSIGFPLVRTTAEPLPPDFSQRDFMSPYRLPKPGDTLDLMNLAMRDFFFAVSIIRQENPAKQHAIKPALYVDGQPLPNYALEDFMLYKGPIDSIPPSLQFDWFFWDRLGDYVHQRFPSQETAILFSLMQEGKCMTRYRVKESCIFVIADSWEKGFDSRFFGLISAQHIEGIVACVLWSFAPDAPVMNALRVSRLGKIVK
jgi:signal peptidase I